MYAAFQKNIKLLLVIISSVISCHILLEKNVLAVDHFADGNTTEVKDQNVPADSYFGGSDSATGTVQVLSTNLTITTQNLVRNTLNNIFGGGRSDLATQNTVTGDVNLIINNTDANQAIGGSFNGGSLVTIGGSVYLTINNSTFTTGVYGGSIPQALGDVAQINGSIHMNLNQVTTPTLFGAGNAVGPAPNNIPVGGDVNIAITESQITNMWLTSQNDDIHVSGNTTLTTSNSIINFIYGTENSNIHGGLNLYIGDGTTVRGDIVPTKNGNITNEVTIAVTNATVRNIYLGPNGTGIIGGPVTLSVQNSTIGTITCGPAINGLLNEAFVTIDNSNINLLQVGPARGTTNTITATSTNSIFKQIEIGGVGQVATATVTMNDSTVDLLTVTGLGANIDTTIITTNNGSINTFTFGGTGNIGTAVATITNGDIGTFMLGDRSNIGAALINITNGAINDLMIGGPGGQITAVTANLNKVLINTLTLGSPQKGGVGIAILNIDNSEIDSIITENADISEIYFLPGNMTVIGIAINGPGLVDNINVQKGAQVQWGKPYTPFELKAKNLILSGSLLIPQGSTANLTIEGMLTADGGWVIPESLIPGAPPILQFIGSSQSTLLLAKPLSFYISLSPELIGAKGIPIATTTPQFANASLFTKQNREGLIWSDLLFDSSNNTWILTNIRVSEDLYGLSSAREASNWLRQQHIWNIQRRSSKLLEKFSTKSIETHALEKKKKCFGKIIESDYDGLWIELQGGHEKLDAALGESKMPWGMASVGYDYLNHFSCFPSLKSIFGFGLGSSFGQDTWSTINTTKNDIILGMLAGYLGLIHTSGLYGTITAQCSFSNIKTKCSGFTKNHTWNEIIPTGAAELGWQYRITKSLKINPHGQIIVEQLSKQRFTFPYEKDTITLEKVRITTVIAGLSGEYTFYPRAPISIQLGVDWIKGLSGDFATKSTLLKKRFKDKNDSNTLRASFDFQSQLNEQLNVHLNTFSDFKDDKGFGGQFGMTFTF